MHSSVGPASADKFFKCANGDICTLQIVGNGLATKDRVAIIPLHERCGHAPAVRRPARPRASPGEVDGVSTGRKRPWWAGSPDRTNSFTIKTFSLGRIALSKTGAPLG